MKNEHKCPFCGKEQVIVITPKPRFAGDVPEMVGWICESCGFGEGVTKSGDKITLKTGK